MSATPAVIDLQAVREVRTEGDALDAQYGVNAYASFLRKNGRRPNPDEAAVIGRMLGGRVRANNGTMQPPLTDRERHERKITAERYRKIVLLKAAVAALAELGAPEDLAVDRSLWLEDRVLVAQIGDAVCWLNRFVECWHGRAQNTSSEDPEPSHRHQEQERA